MFVIDHIEFVMKNRQSRAEKSSAALSLILTVLTKQMHHA